MASKKVEDIAHDDGDFTVAAEAYEAARAEAAEEEEYTLSNPGWKELRDDGRRFRMERRVVVLGTAHHAQFDVPNEQLDVFCDGSEPRSLQYFDPESFTDEELVERLWTALNFG